MKIIFNKYEGAGNDFIIIRNTPALPALSNIAFISHLCNRRFGIGADGLILIEESPGYDFRMLFYNSDGSPGAMCGNGARCAAHFAMRHITGFRQLQFLAGDGPHTARLADEGFIELSITDVGGMKEVPDGLLVDTGVPHLVVFTDDNSTTDVTGEGRRLRWLPHYAPEGVNVNFVTISDGRLSLRTYERGVEDETLACGTGATAAAIAAAHTGKIVTGMTEVTTPGGRLTVRFDLTDRGARNIFLGGPATFVFSGEKEIENII